MQLPTPVRMTAGRGRALAGAGRSRPAPGRHRRPGPSRIRHRSQLRNRPTSPASSTPPSRSPTTTSTSPRPPPRTPARPCAFFSASRSSSRSRSARPLLLRTYVVAPYYIPSESMEPTLHGCTGCNDDHVLVDKFSYRLHDPHQSDIVVFTRPPAAQTTDHVLIKRVIGLPGDRVVLKHGNVYINGKRLKEPYVRKACGPHPTRPETGQVAVAGAQGRPVRARRQPMRLHGQPRVRAHYGVVGHRPGLRHHLAAGPHRAVVMPQPEPELSAPAPRVPPMTQISEGPALPQLPGDLPPVGARLAVPLARRGFQDLPADVSLPLHRSAARGTVAGRHPRHARARGARVVVRPAGRPTARSTAARALLPEAWARVREQEPEIDALFADDADGSEFTDWMSSAAELLANYFTLEDPRRFEPAAREQLVEVVVDGVRLRGFVDRLDVSPGGRRSRRRLQDGRLAPRGVRGQGAVPDEVLRTRALAHPRRRAAPAAADVPRRHRHAQLLARRRRARCGSSAP